MHIAFLTPEYPGIKTGHSGGIGTSIQNLALALVARGANVSIFVYGQSSDEQYTEHGITFYRLQNIRLKGLSWILSRIKVQRILNKAIRETSIDILEVADWTGFSAFMQINCPIVMRLNGSDTFFCYLDKRPVKKWNRFLETTAFRQADAIIAVSDFVGRTTNSLFHTHKPYTVIPNSIDINNFPLSIASGYPPVIIYFGTLIRKKGVLDIPPIFNRVIEQHPEVKLLLIGGDSKDIHSGSDSTWQLMHPLFTENALTRVEYLGRKSYSELTTFIQQASICVFPSYAEACPVSWLEAMSMGKAIVASNIGWASELIIHQKEGLLAHPADHETMAKQIVALLTNINQRLQLGHEAHNKVLTHFDNAVVVEKNITFYSGIISDK